MSVALRRARALLSVVVFALVAAMNVALASDDDASTSAAKPSPELVLQEFLRAMYSRDAVAVYALTSAADRATKTLEQHVSESKPFDGVALRLGRALAKHIVFDNIVVRGNDKRATVTFDAMLPDANDPAVQKLAEDFDSEKLSTLTAEQVQRRVTELDRRAKDGRLKILRSLGEVWDLVLENHQWTVVQNWFDAIEVKFEAHTVAELGWEFSPVRKQVFAKHGETIHMAYRAKNTSEHESTGKARHIIGPGAHANHLQIIGCFCFLEQTLAPGEEIELPLVFRVAYDAPDDVNDFTVKYEFYPIDKFPPLAHTIGPNG